MNSNQIDPAALDQYREVMGEDADEFIKDIILTFLESSGTLIGELNQSLKENDARTFQRASHTLKTGCATVGAVKLAGEFAKLEKLGEQNNLEDVPSLLTPIVNDLDEIKQTLKNQVS